jgi:hypothetical protein
MFDDDLDIFFDDFAEEIAYIPAPESEPVYIKAIFDAEEEYNDNGVILLGPKITVMTADVPVIQGARFTIQGLIYKIKKPGVNRHGIRELILARD